MIRRVAAVLVLVVAGAVACTDDDTIQFEGGVGSGSTLPADTFDGGRGDPAANGSGDGAPQERSGDAGSSPGGGGGGGAVPGGEGPDSGDGGIANGDDGELPVDGGSGSSEAVIDDRDGVGSAGQALLRSEVDTATIEIDSSPGESLTDEAREALGAALSVHGSKSVTYAEGSQVPAQDVYSSAELRLLMNTHRSTWSADDRAGVYVMVLSGRHENETVVGVSFNATAFAIFSEQLGGGVLGLNYATYEKAVAVHELGHLFGLVNITGYGAFHEDPEHERHSANEGSVMYWAVESTLVGDVFEGGPPTTFDSDDLQEMAAIRAA